jgi:hypothetical protein
VPTLQFTTVYDAVENGWTQARIAEYPAVITAGPTREAAKALVLDALKEYWLSFADDPPLGTGEGERVAVTISG